MQTKSEQANAYVFFSAITYRARPINFPPFQVWRSCKSEYVCVCYLYRPGLSALIEMKFSK